jgi:predicted alpha/beta-hydrolase family hydrolase
MKVYPAQAPRATFVLAHGAGAESKSEWMVLHAKELAKRGVRVVTFDFPKVRSTMTPLEDAYVKIVTATHERFPNEPLSIGGKSMGGRVASLIAAKYTLPIARLVFFGYPLHPPKKPEKRRDAHLPDVKQPMLFLHGTRDPFGTPREMRALCKKLGSELVLFEGQGHDLDGAVDEAAAFILMSLRSREGSSQR